MHHFTHGEFHSKRIHTSAARRVTGSLQIMETIADIWQCICDAATAIYDYLASILLGARRIRIGQRDVYVNELIAEGGFSYVYKAKDSSRQQLNYGLKKINVQSSEAEREVKKEVEMLVRFKHTNIIELLDSCFLYEGNSQIAYLLFPYYERSLRHLLDDAHGRDTKIPLLRILKQFKEICGAVEIIHSQNFVHNDIKPENVLIGTEGESLPTYIPHIHPFNRHTQRRSSASGLRVGLAGYQSD